MATEFVLVALAVVWCAFEQLDGSRLVKATVKAVAMCAIPITPHRAYFRPDLAEFSQDEKFMKSAKRSAEGVLKLDGQSKNYSFYSSRSKM